MCDFHSVIVTGDGRIYHLPSNSHSGIAAHYGLGDAITCHWWECEWYGEDDMPIELVQNRRNGAAEPTQAAYRAAEAHYSKLAEILETGADDSTVFPYPFNQPEYEDVRIRAKGIVLERQKRAAAEAEAQRKAEAEAAADAEAQTAFDEIAEKLGVLDNDIIIRVIHKLADDNSIDVEEIAADEIQEIRKEAEDWDSDHPAYQAGEESGMEYIQQSGDYIHVDSLRESDISDYFSDEQIADAAEDLIDEARTEGYCEGYRDCKQGKPSEHPEYFADGMPSFLF